ncbi:PAS domain-containing protein [Neorhizobium sp. P12A]|uniref:PAS domain-containing protein n=1 Tax=Neorhizobium sp. P12A TaxID=2268027 RepID=UPI0011EC99A2|nr:PAS domain-containing protein [Neorhizobium sp. P12A]
MAPDISAADLKFESIVHALPGMVLVTDPDGVSEFVNRPWCDYTGLSNADSLHTGWQAAIHDDDSARFFREWEQTSKSRSPGKIEARIRRADGEFRWHLFSVSPIGGTTGRAHWCWLVTYSDEARTTSEDLPDGRLRRFMDTLPTQIVFMTPSLEVEFVNERVIEFYGRSLEQLRKYTEPQTVNHPDDLPMIIEKLRLLVDEGQDWANQSRMLHADGTYRWVGSEMVPSKDAQGNIVRYVSVQVDVHELVQARALLAGEVSILKMVALGAPLQQVLAAVCDLVDDLGVGACGVLILRSGGTLFEGGGASKGIRDGLWNFFEGMTIDPSADPSSAAANEGRAKEQIVVAEDPRWSASKWSEVVRGFGFQSSWAIPVPSKAGGPSGIWNIFRRTLGPLKPEEQQIVDRVTTLIGIAIDRAQVDEELRESEARLRRANAQLAQGERISSAGSFTTDLLLDEQTWSEELYRVLEVSPDARPTVQAVRERVHPDDVAFFDEQIERSAKGVAADFTFRIVTPSGAVKHLRGLAEIIDHVDGRPIFMGVVQDVTAIKQAELALRARETELTEAYGYLEQAQRLSRTGSFTWDVHADLHNWSEEIRRIFGFDLDATVTMDMIRAAVHPDDMEEVASVIGGAYEGRDFDLVFRIRTEADDVRYAHVVGHRIESIPDRPVFLGALQDVTESKSAEAALKASEAELLRANSYLSTAQTLSKTGSFSWQVEDRQTQWSPEMSRIFGEGPFAGECFGVKVEQVHPEDRSIFEAIMADATTGHDFDCEFRLLYSPSLLKIVHVVGHVHENGAAGLLYVGAVQDVTELRKGEAALSEARSELAHFARVTTLGALTASITHEIGQPLSGIMMNANAGLRMLTMAPPDVEGASDTIRRTIRDTDRASQVIKRLRALFSRTQKATEPTDLNEVAREVIALTSRELLRNRIILQTNLATELPLVKGDRVQLQQVVLNLLLNAADAMAEVEGRPRSLLVSTGSADDSVYLSVRDEGVGVEPDALAKLFNAFYTTKTHGMGVGLSISKSIIESHRGRIWAAANAGPGATFSFAIPAITRTRAEPGNQNERDPTQGVTKI